MRFKLNQAIFFLFLSSRANIAFAEGDGDVRLEGKMEYTEAYHNWVNKTLEKDASTPYPLEKPLTEQEKAAEDCILKSKSKDEIKLCLSKFALTREIGEVHSLIDTCIKFADSLEGLDFCVDKHNAYQKIHHGEIFDNTGDVLCSKKNYDLFKDIFEIHEIKCAKRSQTLDNKLNDLNKKVEVKGKKG